MDPTYNFAQGHGRFAIRYARLATALGNFEQGNARTESSGGRLADLRTGNCHVQNSSHRAKTLLDLARGHFTTITTMATLPVERMIDHTRNMAT